MPQNPPPVNWTSRPFPVIIRIVNKVARLCLLMLVLLSACGGGTSVPTVVSPTLSPPALSPTPVANTPEATAAAFLSAWQRGDALGMYALLSPASQAAAQDAATFAARYQTAVQTATVLTSTATLQAVLQEGERAQAACHLAWETSLVGTLITDTVLSLAVQGDRWWVEGTGDLIWPGLGEGNYFYMQRQTPARANIYDRDGLALAAEGTVVTVGVVPGRVRDEQAVLTVLNRVTGLPLETIRSRYADRPADWWVPIGEISAETSIQYADLLLNTPGIEAREREGRTYPPGGAPHVIGWVAQVPAEELASYRARGYQGDEYVGVAGLERWAEPYLAGRHGGTLYLMSPAGQPLSIVARRDALPSRAVYTTLDRPLQQQAQATLGDHRGAIVVMDVHTGAILALASGPSFDNNAFANPNSAAARFAIMTDPDHPLINRATQGTYPCGSVFKIVTMAAALERAGMTAATSFFCPGYWDGLGAAYRMSCWREHGQINLQDALSASCDVTFYMVGQALDGIDPDILPEFGRAFGFGQATGLTGVVETAGLVPDPAWKLSTHGEVWRAGDSVNLAIGQGYLLVTPLQVARMVAAVANGGTLYRPYVVARIAASGEEPEIVTQSEAVGTLPVSPEHLAVIQRGMLGTTTNPIGTAAYRFVGMSIPVAGKTGTAQAPGDDSLPHAWFAAYAPADAPEIAVVVMVENSGEGAQVAAPMVRQIVEAYYGLPVTPLPPDTFATPTPTPSP